MGKRKAVGDDGFRTDFFPVFCTLLDHITPEKRRTIDEPRSENKNVDSLPPLLHIYPYFTNQFCIVRAHSSVLLIGVLLIGRDAFRFLANEYNSLKKLI